MSASYPHSRPLPARPSLEFEHKEAKALLRRLRAGDPEALARARTRHPAIDASSPARIRLADAQLVIAREYGFTSWRRLARYFGDVERQRLSLRSFRSEGRGFYDGFVRSVLAENRDRRVWAARTLAAYVPRFYGMRVEEVFASTVTEDDARLAVARSYGHPSWEVLLERIAADARHLPREWEVGPMGYAAKAISAAQLDALQRVVEAHPDLLHPWDVANAPNLLTTALHHERRQGSGVMRPIIEWLIAQGFDLQQELNRQLCGHMNMKADEVRWLLDRGADPGWVAPNGIPVLEHALIRYWNGEAVDVLAARTAPRQALWIAAGLGDVDGVQRFLDARGKPTAAGRRLRPDFGGVGQTWAPQNPEADDEEILIEAFIVAVLNGRTAVLDYMLSRGFPVNGLAWGSPLINMVVGNGMVPIVECLVRGGADLDLRGWRPAQTAREIAREMFEDDSENANRRRIVQLCGMDPDAILAERDARPLKPPVVEPKLNEALEFAADDAFRRGQADVGPENLLFGLLRSGGLPLDFFTKYSRIDLDRFRADVWSRVHPNDDRVDRPKLALNDAAQAMVQAAIASATGRRRETVNGLHLLHALTQDAQGPAARLLTQYGANPTTCREEVARML